MLIRFALAAIIASTAAAHATDAVPKLVDGAALAGKPASELVRRRVKLTTARAIAEPDLAGLIAKGGERVIPPVVAPPAKAPVPGEPDLAFGAFQRGFYRTALAFAMPRAEAGDAAAQTLIAELHASGRGVSRNIDTARGWYERAAANGDPQAQFAYASLLMADVKRGQPRPRAARDYMERAARAGHARAQFNLAQMIVDDRPSYRGFEQALPFYRGAAEQGLPDAQYALAVMLAEGNGTPIADHAAARRWLERAAANGFDTAQLELGIWMINGKGGAVDVESGRAWLERAARDGNVVAQNRLARIHALGIGTLVDPVKAGAWHVMTRRVGFPDPEMDRKFAAYTPEQQKAAMKLANAWRQRSVVARPDRTAGP